MKRICVVTGASAGIGAAAALELARRGDQVVLIGRTPAKLDAVARRIADATGDPPDTHVADFADLGQVREVASALSADYERIDVLANNAGLVSSEQTITVDGHELTMQVNHLAGFLLTNLLLNRLGRGSRVITTASAMAAMGRLDPGDLTRAGSRYSKWRAYGDSKQANILFTVELARRLRDRGAAATCFHPGLVRSDFGAGLFIKRLYRLFPPFTKTPEEGAQTLVHLATHQAGLAGAGRYFSRSRPARSPSRASDAELAGRLWEASRTAAGLPSAVDDDARPSQGR